MNAANSPETHYQQRSSELTMRLRDLLEGPWAEEGKKAHKYLRPKESLENLYGSEQVIKMEHFQKTLPRKERERIGIVSRLLRLHWKGHPVTKGEIPLRDSFDEALTVLQLLELAIETGYLPVEAVRTHARQYIIELLWSPGARAFVRGYDYFLVERIAARVQAPLSKRTTRELAPPQIAPAKFATFLSFHGSWYGNEELDWWLGLMDDYVTVDDIEGLKVEEWDEAEAFETYLHKRKLPNQQVLDAMLYVDERFRQRTAGALWFVSRLSGFLKLLTDEELPIYASFYAYWLAKLFGYELGDDGYVRVDGGWEKDLLTYVRRSGKSELEIEVFEKQLTFLKTALTHVITTMSEPKRKVQVKRIRQ